MKLKNKKTGEIGWLYCDHISIPKKMTVFSEDKDFSAKHWDYSSLAELNAEWEDAPEEPERAVSVANLKNTVIIEMETEKEAEEMVKRLKANERLNAKGFVFKHWSRNQTGTIDVFCGWKGYPHHNCVNRDLELLFGKR